MIYGRLKLFITSFRRGFLSPSKIKRSYSQCAEDLIIEAIFRGRDRIDNGFYVDVGCHHPRRGSNTFSLYKRGWRGILVDMEKTKVMAARLARRKDTVVQAAVSDTVEFAKIYSPNDFSTNATINLEVAKADSEYKEVGAVTTTTLTEILNRYSCPGKFDLLNVDCEGNDLKVLLGLDLVTYSPRVICVEIWEASSGLSGLLDSAINKHLEKFNYSLRGWSTFSAIYVSKDFG